MEESPGPMGQLIEPMEYDPLEICESKLLIEPDIEIPQNDRPATDESSRSRRRKRRREHQDRSSPESRERRREHRERSSPEPQERRAEAEPRPLPGHSSIGSINTRTELHPGVPPPTTESNKGGSVPVDWQKTRHGAYLKYTQNIMLQHQGEDPTGKPDTPYLQH
ncbi:hypothetical protein TNCV_2937521 [Trichonephila clavipes]|nr:hypothetical protein TNCV_2937521 [Trichonephila clavipes]